MNIKLSNNLYYFLFCLALIALAVFFHADHFLNGDEGVVLNGAWNLFNGRRLYLDFFSFLPPLSFFLIFWFWEIVGVSFVSAKIFSIILLLLGALGLYKIATRLRPGIINLFIPLFFILISSWWWIINHNVYQLIFSIWSAYFLLTYFKNNHWSNLLWSALLSALAIATLQQKGLLLTIASVLILIFLSKQSWHRRCRDVLIYIFSVIAPLASLLFFWPLSVLWQNLVIFPLFNYLEVNRIPYYLLVLALFSWLLMFWALRAEGRDRTVLLILSGIFVVSCYPLPDYYHLSLALVLLIPLLPDLLKINHNFWSKIHRLLASAGLIWLWLWPVSVFFSFIIFNFSFSRNYFFLDYIRRECPGKYLQVGPFLPNVYLETGKLSATAFDILVTGHQTPGQFAEAALQLQINQPSCAVTAYPQSLSRFNHQLDNPVDNFIRANYKIVFTEGPVNVWRRLEDKE